MLNVHPIGLPMPIHHRTQGFVRGVAKRRALGADTAPSQAVPLGIVPIVQQLGPNPSGTSRNEYRV